MTWEVLVPLIIQHGLPLALKLAEKWQSKDAVQPSEIEELKALASHSPKTQMRDALARAGISLDDPKAKELLALVNG